MQLTLLGWLVLERTDSAMLVALVGFALMSPLLVFGLAGGVVADSPGRLAVNRSLQAINLAASTALAVALALDAAPAFSAYPVALATGTAWAFDQPFKRRAVRDMLGAAGTTNGIALESVAMTASRLIGPAVGGVLITTVGVRGGYPVIVGLSAAALLLLSIARVPPPSGVGPEKADTRRLLTMLDGVRHVAGSRLLLGTVAVTFAVNLLIFPYMQVVLVVARDVLMVESGLGLLLAADGLGSLGAALLIATLYPRYGRLGLPYMLGSTLAGLGLLALSFQGSYAGALLSLLLMGVGLAGFSTMQAAIVVVNTGDEVRGKALGVVTLAIGAGPLGAVLVGFLANYFGPQVALRIDAAAALAAVAALWLLVPEFRARMGGRTRRTATPRN